MLKRILLICTIVFSMSAKAQFTIDHDTIYALGYAANSSSGFADIYEHTILRHTGIGQETIKWVRTQNNLPDPKWTSAVCDIISCRGPQEDTGSFQITGSDTGLLSFHFYPINVRGTGTMTVKFYRASNPMEFSEVVVIGQAWKAVAINAPKALSLSVYPNPANDHLFVSQTEINKGRYEIMDANGKLILSADFVSGQSIDIALLESGLYTLRLIGDNQVAVQTFVKE